MAVDAGYGTSHSGKSTALEVLARHIIEKTGKIVRVAAWDGGGETYNNHGLVDAGKIELVDFSVLEYPLTVLKLAQDFWWPKDWKDPSSKLVAPPVNLFEQVGLYIFEAGGMGDWMLSDIPGGMAWHSAQDDGFGGVKDEDGELSTKDAFTGADGKIDDRILQGVNSPKHFFQVQRKLVSAIRSTKKFPGLAFWTFWETEAAAPSEGGETKDFGKIVGKKIFGPNVGGKALADRISGEFGNMFHFDQTTTLKDHLDPATNKQIKEVLKEYRLYTKRHYDPNQQVMTEYLAGTRLQGLKEYYTSSAKNPGDSLLQVYQAMHDVREANKIKQQETK